MESIVLGVEFFRYPGPDEAALIRDLERIAEAGYKAIRLQQVWSYAEPMPGKTDFHRLDGRGGDP